MLQDQPDLNPMPKLKFADPVVSSQFPYAPTYTGIIFPYWSHRKDSAANQRYHTGHEFRKS